MTAEADAIAVYKIRDGVAKVSRPAGSVLVAPADGRSLRISKVGEELLPLLAVGAPFVELEQRLRQRHPKVLDSAPKLRAFLAQLAGVGLLDSEPAAPRPTPARYPLFSPDRGAAAVAGLVHRLPASFAWLLLAMALMLAAASTTALVLAGELPHPLRLFDSFSIVGFALFAFLLVPIHEAAHALACRLSGAPVGKAGIILHGWIMPGPYVDTSHTYRIEDRWKRFWVPAAGPLVNFLGLGSAAAILLFYDGDYKFVDPAAVTLFLFCAAFVVLDTNPLAPSDGSRMIEALVGDDLARRSALSRRRHGLSGMREVQLYRIACSVHVQLVCVAGYFWWTGTAQVGV